jgi:hypothetical protein
MATGNETFINTLLDKAGFQNVVITSRYPKLTADDIKSMDPELILLSSEPFPFNDSHVSEIGSICPSASIMKVDGELFSWYGSRLTMAANYFSQLHAHLSRSRDF